MGVDKREEKLSDEDHREETEEKVDHELGGTFPASDPPSYSQPGNDVDAKNFDIKDPEN